MNSRIVSPVDSFRVPHFARLQILAQLSRLEDMGTCDIAVMGAPFDAGVSYRPGARFSHVTIRTASQSLCPHCPGLDLEFFITLQIANAGNVMYSSLNVQETVANARDHAQQLLDSGCRIAAVGDDHTIALPLLHTITKRYRPIVLPHFDANLDTWHACFNAEVTHRAVYRRASEEGLPEPEALCHVGIQGSLYAKSNISDDQRMEFGSITVMDVTRPKVDNITAPLRARVGRPSPLHRHQRPRPYSCTRHGDSKGWLHHHSGTSRDTSRPD